MEKSIKLHDIGEGVVEGEIVEWLKSEGESVEKDETVIIIMTDKATVELPSPEKGTIKKHYYKKGDMASVGSNLYDIEFCLSKDNITKEPQEKKTDESIKLTKNSIQSIKLHDIGEGVVEGEIVEWLKSEGEFVEKDETVVIIMTDKATVELPSPEKGTIKKHYYKKGEMASVGSNLYDIELYNKKNNSNEEEQKHKSTNSSNTIKENLEHKYNSKIKALPMVRHLAEILELDLNDIKPSGKYGEITSEDLKKYVNIQKKEPSELKEIPLSGIRKVISNKMTKSKQIIPHATFTDRINLSNLFNFREELKKNGNKVSFMIFFIKALSNALSELPIFNSSLDIFNEKIILNNRHNIGIITDTKHGASSIVLKDTQNKSFSEINEEFKNLLNKARNGTLSTSDTNESTISISNFGSLGGLTATPIINYPESTMLGIGKMEDAPLVEDGKIVIRKIAYTCWSIDHRILDGADVAKLSNKFSYLIENPEIIFNG